MDVARASEGTFDGGTRNGSPVRYGYDRRWATAGATIAVVHFSPDARTRWHRHPTGQFLYAISGRGRVRTRDENGHVLEPGDVIHVGPEGGTSTESRAPRRWCTWPCPGERWSGASP